MNERHGGTLLSIAISLTAFCLGASSSAQETAPVGAIVATPTVVQTGMKPTLTWSIKTPSSVKDFILITAPATLVASRTLIADVRILGAGVTSQYPNGGTRFYETMCQMKFNGATSWTTIFDGLHTDPVVRSQGIVSTFTPKSGQGNAINLAGRYRANNFWSPMRTTASGDYVVALTNGDPCPARIPSHNSPALKHFLKPYLDESNRVKIGPMDVIVFMELTHINPADAGFDGQDLVLLITFRTP